MCVCVCVCMVDSPKWELPPLYQFKYFKYFKSFRRIYLVAIAESPQCPSCALVFAIGGLIFREIVTLKAEIRCLKMVICMFFLFLTFY